MILYSVKSPKCSKALYNETGRLNINTYTIQKQVDQQLTMVTLTKQVSLKFCFELLD